jgi:nitroreductase
MIDAGIRAATGSNQQSWRFVIVRDTAKKQAIAAWYRDTWTQYGRAYIEDPAAIEALPRQQQLVIRSAGYLADHIAEVPVLLIVCGPKGETPGAAAGSIFPCVQNMLLAARAQGLGSVMTTFHKRHEREVCELLGIPEGYETYVLLPVGYPTDRHGPVRRRPVREIAFVDSWGEAWPFAQTQPDEGFLRRWVQ